MTEHLHGVYRKKGDILDRMVAGQAFLIPIRGKLADLQRIFALTPVAAFIWNQMDGKRALADIASGIVKEFNVSEAKATQDLTRFAAVLQDADLITEAAAHELPG